MSEVKRYYVGDAGLVEGQALGRINVVLGADHDRVTAERYAALGREAALREELSTAQRGLANCKLALDAQTHNYGVTNLRLIGAEQRLTAADERADVLESVVALLIKVTPRNKSSFADKIKAMEILAALKPAEGGGDVARLAMLPENQRITPARFKCLACGEYHEGSGNLPCPSMSTYSRIEQ